MKLKEYHIHVGISVNVDDQYHITSKYSFSSFSSVVEFSTTIRADMKTRSTGYGSLGVTLYVS